MAFNQYQYDQAAFQKLPFLGELIGYLHTNSKGDFKKGALFKISEEDCLKISKKLKGDDTSSIMPKDKVFILPNCTIPLFKMKEYLKATGATQVSDIKEATKIIGHGNISSENGNNSLLREIGYVIRFEDLTGRHSNDTIRQLIEFHKNNPYEFLDWKEELKTVIVAVSMKGTLGWVPKHWENYKAITPTCALILYYQMQNKIPVVSEDAVFKAIQKPMVIDQEVYETLCSMLKSSDSANQVTAIELISNCDIDLSYYYLWRLAREYDNVFALHRRNKNFRLFKEKINFSLLSIRAERAILPILEEKGVLTPQIYSELINQVIRTYKHKVDTELFDVILVPTGRFAKYTDQTQFVLTKTKKEPEEEEQDEEVSPGF